MNELEIHLFIGFICGVFIGIFSGLLIEAIRNDNKGVKKCFECGSKVVMWWYCKACNGYLCDVCFGKCKGMIGELYEWICREYCKFAPEV